jgi:hypothetical protein
MLVGAATSAARTKGAYLKDKFHRLKARRGAMRAALAIAHKILVAAYHMLTRACLTANSEKPTSTRLPRPEPSPTSNDVSSASATTSPSNQRRSPHDPSSPLKLFSWQRQLQDETTVICNQLARESLLNRRLSVLSLPRTSSRSKAPGLKQNAYAKNAYPSNAKVGLHTLNASLEKPAYSDRLL